MIQAYIELYHNNIQVYTDASKASANKIGVGFYIAEFHLAIGRRVSDGLSVLTGEMLAIVLALQWIEDIRPLRTVIC